MNELILVGLGLVFGFHIGIRVERYFGERYKKHPNSKWWINK